MNDVPPTPPPGPPPLPGPHPGSATTPGNPSEAARTSRLAITAAALAPLGILILPAIASVICGILAFSQIGRSQGRLKGNGLALTGIIVSGLSLILLPFLAVGAGLMIPALSKARAKAGTIRSVNNVKTLCLGVRVFMTDHEERFPEATTWCEIIEGHVHSPQVFLREGDRPENRSSYAFNAALSGKLEKDVAPDTVLIFESAVPGWNQSGGVELLRTPTHGSDLIVVGFVDGHVEQVSRSRLDGLRWDP